MNTKIYCVIDSDNFYRTIIHTSITENPSGEQEEVVVGYKLAKGERLLDVRPPTIKHHAGNAGFVKPCWDEETAAWVEGATAEELAAWEAEHPAPPTPPPSRVEVLEAEVARLRAQNELQAQHQTFLEDCLLEMGNIVYA